MKENKLIEMKNKVEALTRISQHLLNEISQLKDLAVGTLETIKYMPDYDEAIQKLKDKVTKKPGETKQVDTSGKTFE